MKLCDLRSFNVRQNSTKKISDKILEKKSRNLLRVNKALETRLFGFEQDERHNNFCLETFEKKTSLYVDEIVMSSKMYHVDEL